MRPELRRFFKYVDWSAAGGDCWLWIGARGGPSATYGVFYLGGHGYAHRAAYELFVGPIPEGLEIDHLCRVKCCVNPQHLEAVTHRENVRRGLKGELTTHCPEGHRYDEPNTYRDRDGRRKCRACHRVRERARRARLRGETFDAAA